MQYATHLYFSECYQWGLEPAIPQFLSSESLALPVKIIVPKPYRKIFSPIHHAEQSVHFDTKAPRKKIPGISAGYTQKFTPMRARKKKKIKRKTYTAGRKNAAFPRDMRRVRNWYVFRAASNLSLPRSSGRNFKRDTFTRLSPSLGPPTIPISTRLNLWLSFYFSRWLAVRIYFGYRRKIIANFHFPVVVRKLNFCRTRGTTDLPCGTHPWWQFLQHLRYRSPGTKESQLHPLTVHRIDWKTKINHLRDHLVDGGGWKKEKKN